MEWQHVERGLAIFARSLQPFEVRPDHAAEQDLGIGVAVTNRLRPRVEHGAVVLQCTVPPERHVLLVVDLV
jgi:hypothetical protein